jgi:hypothetical protein
VKAQAIPGSIAYHTPILISLLLSCPHREWGLRVQILPPPVETGPMEHQVKPSGPLRLGVC